MSEPSDAELVARCLRDEAAAWEALTHRYANVVYVIALRQGLDSDQASDVVGAVFAALLRGLRRLRSADRLVGWIVRTTRREAWRLSRQYRQRKKREQAVATPEHVGSPPPDEEVARLELQAMVRIAFGALGERCRRLLDALFLTEAAPAYAEIARGLGLAIGSIGSLRRRCLEALRGELVRLGVTDEAWA